MGVKAKLKRIVPICIWNRLKLLKSVYFGFKIKRKQKKVVKYQPGKYPFGVNLIGDIRAETGLGQSMRMVAELLEQSKISFLIRQMDAPGELEHLERQWDYKVASHNKYGVNLIHINNSIWNESYSAIPVYELNGRYNIAYWLWELEDFPDEWVPCIETVDEIWTPAEFISKGIRKKTNKPVLTMPYGMKMDTQNLLGREYFKLPEDKFLFLVMYDFWSISERKNPRGAIQAYRKAFKESDTKIGIVIKVNHLNDKNELEQLKVELEEYPNVYYITDNLSRREVESLIASVDVLVSLHRAEGFGLPLAEAMYLGTVVIATNWSAPVEFMDEKSVCLVDYRLVELAEDIGPYHKGNYWAEADGEQASAYMKRLAEDSEFFDDKIRKGWEHIRETLNMDKMAEQMAKRIGEICDEDNKRII